MHDTSISLFVFDLFTDPSRNLNAEFDEENIAELEELDLQQQLGQSFILKELDELLDPYASKRDKSKGGRIRAVDARLNPNIDPRKAARIMANRQEHYLKKVQLHHLICNLAISRLMAIGCLRPDQSFVKSLSRVVSVFIVPGC